jgi:hypothetical protein
LAFEEKDFGKFKKNMFEKVSLRIFAVEDFVKIHFLNEKINYKYSSL